MTDLTTTYLGLSLKSPLVASSSPLTDSLDKIRRLEDVGISAVVLPSLFEEQLDLESQAVHSDLARGADSSSESLSYLPELHTYNLGPDMYLELLRKASRATSIPIIASLNGVSPGGWIRYSQLMQQAGASAIELNYYAVETFAHRTAEAVEHDCCGLVKSIKESVRIPVAVKLSPFFSAFANMAKRLEQAGADGLILFNRFYQPDLDIESSAVVPSLTLSTSQELLLRLHWTAILYGHVSCDIAVTGGVHTAHDLLKSMMAGASVAMMASALLQHGAEHAKGVLQETRNWMEEHEYESIRQMRGSMSRSAVPDASAYERGNYMRVLSSYTLRTL